MTLFDDDAAVTQCVLYDKTPGSQQKKIILVIRPSYTVVKMMRDVFTLYHYKHYDLFLQPNNGGNLVYLNARTKNLIYELPGFQPLVKNTLILLPPGVWDGNVSNRFDLSTTTTTTNTITAATMQRPLKPSKLVSVVEADSTTTTTTTHVSLMSTTTTTITKEREIYEKSSYGFHSLSNNDNNNSLPHNGAKNWEETASNGYAGGVSNNENNNSLPHSSTKNWEDLSNGFRGFSNNDSNSMDFDQVMSNGSPIYNSESLHPSPMSDLDTHLSDDEDDLALGASASPTEAEPMNSRCNNMLRDPFVAAMSAAHNSVIGAQLMEEDIKSKLISSNNNKSFQNYTPDRKVSRNLFHEEQQTVSKSINYVGLVNQAMTCYLNSLLQALYMTPEFRNAIYRWEFDNDNKAKNIPYHLQKLFLHLQTSKKTAVETTDLTRSFGWDSTEVWQQHDIQELCRVMFDTLERKFMTTKQANLIANLYEGSMIDYVKCLECKTEKTRADKFLDIPLPVRPYGSTVAYGSIEEALRGFVQPETLDGNNQYSCEKCNKKCDAHKGLKFRTFPYILTLHLKRFDFDYTTMQRIKLNDAVTFPQLLNLNEFAHADETKTMQENDFTNDANAQKTILTGGSNTTDDCSTADSGSAMEEDNFSSGIATTASSSQHDNDMNNDDDEGIDLSTNSTTQNVETRSGVINSMQLSDISASGPFMYELFAIMIHSGSATGGHYYAYIKEFETNKWFCFNDQNVTPITNEDIERSFGDGANRAHYPSVYTSSTNAYMLMYRQVDPQRNERAMTEAEFPEHIVQLLPSLLAEDEARLVRAGHHATPSVFLLPEMMKPRVYFYNPALRKMKSTRVLMSRNLDLNVLLESAYHVLGVDRFAPMSRCRVVGFDPSCDVILQSYEDADELHNLCEGPTNFLLEYCVEGQEFEVYKAGGATWDVFKVNLNTMEIDGPFFVHSPVHERNDVLRRSIAIRLFVKENELLLATLPSKQAFVAYDSMPTLAAEEHLLEVARSHFKNLTYFYINVPSTDAQNLKFLGIPYEEEQNKIVTQNGTDVVDAVILNGDTNAAQNLVVIDDNNKYAVHMSSLSPVMSLATGSESNSDDSSFSDSDRTLVPNMMDSSAGSDSQISSTSSQSPQLSSPENETVVDFMQRINTLYKNNHNNNKSNNMNGENLRSMYTDGPSCSNSYGKQTLQNDSTADVKSRRHFFHAIRIDDLDNPYTALSEITMSQNNRTAGTGSNNSSSTTTASSLLTGDSIDDPGRKPIYTLKILTDSRITMGELKSRLESIIGVPSGYFKIRCKHETSEPLNPSQIMVFLNEGETLCLELGKIKLESNENKAKISYMRMSELNNETGKLPHICDWFYTANMTVAMGKHDLIAKLQRLDAEKYASLNFDNLRLWLKGGRNPVKVLDDDLLLANEVRTNIASEFLIEQVEPGQVTQSPENNGLIIFVRKWQPDTMMLHDFQELIMNRETEIRNALSQISDIPEEFIAYTKINTSFPCTNISLLSINTSLCWFSVPATLEKYPLTTTLDGNVYFYKDTRIEPVELSTADRRKWNVKERARLDRLGFSSTSLISPRRERALKIHMDHSPSKSAADGNSPSTEPSTAVDEMIGNQLKTSSSSTKATN